MRLLRITAKYLLIFIFVCLVTIFAGSTYYTYQAVGLLSQVSSQQETHEENLSAVLKMTKVYLQDIHSYEKFLQEAQPQNWPTYCSTLCKPSNFNEERYLEDRTEYLEAFYKEHKKGASADPHFRMKVAQMEFLRLTLPQDLRTLATETLNSEGINNRLVLSLRLEAAFLKELPFVQEHLDKSKLGYERLEQLRALNEDCGTEKLKVLVNRCEALVQN